MGIKLFDLVPKQFISWEDLKHKKIGVDASNSLYQFIASIRQPDGTPLMDKKGKVTSHLMGLFSRTSNLLQKGIKLAYVFDGKMPTLKIYEQERRAERKRFAEKKLKQAKKEDDIELMKKYSKQTSRLTPDMVKEAKTLVKALGLPVIQAPSESDAQGALMCEKKDIYAFASSDADCLLHGCPRTIPNLTLSQRRRMPSGSYVIIRPEMIELKRLLKDLKLKQDQLIILGILIGTDYNVGGIKGIGPKKALNLVHQYKNFDKLFKEAKAEFNWKKIFAIFKSMPVMKNYQLKWTSVDEEAVKKLLVDKHDFSEERVDNTLQKITKRSKSQKSLDSWAK